MTVITDVFKELLSMFVADARLTLAGLVLVMAVAGALSITPVEDHVALGFAMLAGCIVIIVTVTVLHARRARREKV